jgi:hypothetical protein
MPDPTPPSSPAPRYLRFLTALLLGAAVATPVVLVTTACSDDGDDGADDEPMNPDAVADAALTGEGPLPPPDRPRTA